MGLLTKGDEFERGFATHVEKATEELGNTLSILAPPESANVRRTNVLREIVANASKLAIEVCWFCSPDRPKLRLTLCDKLIDSQAIGFNILSTFFSWLAL